MDDPDDGVEKRLTECRIAVWACVYGLILTWALASTLKWGDLAPAHLTWAGIIVGPRDPFRSDRFLFCFRALASTSVVDGVPACPARVLRRDAGQYVGRTRLQQILDDLGLDPEDEDRCAEGGRWPGSQSDFGTAYSPWGRADPFGLGLTGYCSGCAGATRSEHGLQTTVIAPYRSRLHMIFAPYRSLSLPPTGQDRSLSLPRRSREPAGIAPFRSFSLPAAQLAKIPSQ
jgi:hypothetical protein